MSPTQTLLPSAVSTELPLTFFSDKPGAALVNPTSVSAAKTQKTLPRHFAPEEIDDPFISEALRDLMLARRAAVPPFSTTDDDVFMVTSINTPELSPSDLAKSVAEIEAIMRNHGSYLFYLNVARQMHDASLSVLRDLHGRKEPYFGPGLKLIRNSSSSSFTDEQRQAIHASMARWDADCRKDWEDVRDDILCRGSDNKEEDIMGHLGLL